MTDEKRSELKAPILDYFKDINYHMNNCMAYDSLDKMLDRLIDEVEERPHGEWEKDGFFAICSECGHELQHYELVVSRLNFCPNCGASMQASYRQVTGKLNEEPKDSHSEYWNSIGEWKEGEKE